MEVIEGALPFEVLESFKEALKETGLRSFPLFKDSKCLSLFENKEVCALLLYRDLDEETIELDFIVTSSQRRKRGLAQRLFDHLKQQHKKIWLEVLEKNQAAVSFYKKQGFKVEGRRQGYYNGEDALLMTLVV